MILQAALNPKYAHLLQDAVEYGKKNGRNHQEKVSFALDKLLVNFGCEILKIVPGRVSTVLIDDYVDIFRKLMLDYPLASKNQSKRH